VCAHGEEVQRIDVSGHVAQQITECAFSLEQAPLTGHRKRCPAARSMIGRG
jgi:hypothetical protein